ncbi:uncharacterized protein Pyn_08898 [Prunus yedoensis var. nudiflora]|uniref:PHD-type domain-containing protein n=1 Tax=Prunus yedoensis var. nudiflora TaxID=2094558 RepID=A0A314ZEM5_PRUYE|nr:uncharacterized protein Pyn_08898 [Prunus yedoensis var. nudiflora]
MKEGLRSGKLKVDKDKLGVEKRGDELKQGGSDLGGENCPHLVSSGPEEPEREILGDKAKKSNELGSDECGADGDTGESKNVGAAEIGKKQIDDDGLEKKKVKEKEVDGNVQIVRRVLRSQSAVNGGCDKAVRGGALVTKSRESGGSHNQCTDVKNEGVYQLGSEECGEDGDTGESKNVGAAEIGKKQIDDDGLEKKKVKEKEVDGKVQIVRRVLRSRSVVNEGCDKAVSDGALVTKNRESGGSHNQSTEVKNEGVHQLGESENVGVGEIRKKRRRVDDGQDIDDDDIERKKMKEERIAGRALRSRFVEYHGCDKAESVGKSRASYVSREKCTEVKNEEGGQLVGGFTKKLKGKRGRPPKVPKVEKEESDRSAGGLKKQKKLKRKRGRPRKVEKEESGLVVGQLRKKLKSEQGRPLKVQESNVALKGKLHKGKKMKAKITTNGSNLERRIIGKELDVKTFSPDKRDKKEKDLESEDGEGNKECEQKRKGNKEQKNEQKDQDGELARSRQKQLVRDKMVELILRAGWTIDYRPRNGKEYKDAVYVSPAGRTHWSVTKAYKALKKHCEDGDGKAGFKFTPIPPEEVNKLKRIVVKKREGKKKAKQKGKDGREGGINEKKKGKAGSRGDGLIEEKKKKKMGKSLKGKRLLIEQDDSASRACKGRLSLVKDHEQHKTKNRKRCALLVRNSENADSENDGYIPYDGKRTVLAWMIDLGTLSLNSKVKYMNMRKTQVLLEGRITRDGVHCGCCRETISLSKFVTHAQSDYSEPFKHIYLDSGSSLLQCLLDSWNKQDEYDRRGFHFVDVNREDPNDDTCGICGDGGDLICCDGCPSTFHQSCLEIKKFPSGEWHCVYCSCKFCGMFCGNTCQRDGDENVASSALITCHLCEEKYHRSCIQAKDAVNDDFRGPSFCGRNCQELFESLQKLLGVRREIEGGFSLTLIRRSDIGSDVSLCNTPQEDGCDSKLIECNSKLAVAFLIMDECFLPMVDHRSGVNLIHNILYNRGSNFSRLNYGGFVTAILERGEEIISAASIRIHGNYLAEMPFIGTRYMYRRQGMCRRLLTAIESPLEESGKQKMKNMKILVFPGVDILQKPLLKQLTEANMIPVEGLGSTELEHQQIGQEVLCYTNEKLLAGSGSEATAPCGNEFQSSASVRDVREVEVDTQHNHNITPEVESKYCTVHHIDSEAPDAGLKILSASGEGTENIDCEVRIEDVTIKNLNSRDEGSICRSTESNATELQASHDARDLKHHGSQHLQFAESTFCPNGKMFETCEAEYNHPATERTPTVIVEETSKVSSDAFHLSSVLAHQKADDFEGHRTQNSHHSCGANLQCNGITKSPDVTHVDSTPNRSPTDTKSLKKSEFDSRVDNTSAGANLQSNGITKSPDVTDVDLTPKGSPTDTKSLKQSEFDSRVDNSSAGANLQSNGITKSPGVTDVDLTSNGSPTDTKSLKQSEFDSWSAGANLQSNGITKSPDVTHADSTPNGSLTDTKSLKKSEFDSWVDNTSAGANLRSNGITKYPDVTDVDLTPNRSPSLKPSEFDSRVDNTSDAQCDPSNTSVVALHCGSSGGNSAGTSEVIIVSNSAS